MSAGGCIMDAILTLQQKRLLRVDEAARILNISRWTVYRWVEDGRLGGTRLGAGSLRIFSETVAALIDHHCVGVPVTAVVPEGEPSPPIKRPGRLVVKTPTVAVSGPGSRLPCDLDGISSIYSFGLRAHPGTEHGGMGSSCRGVLWLSELFCRHRFATASLAGRGVHRQPALHEHAEWDSSGWGKYHPLCQPADETADPGE